MRFQEFVPEQARHREGIDVEEHEDAEDPSAVWITASSHGRELGRVKFYRQGDTVVAQSLEVKPEYQGQGIARIMYDYAKELGYRILRSADQTAAGAGFWDRYRGRTGVWEDELNEINAAGQLKVDPSLIERFTNAGWQVLGEGNDQIVLAKPGARTVMKIVGRGSNARQAEIRKYVEFFRAHQRDPHFPRVGPDRELDWNGQKYYAYTQERMSPLSGDEEVLDYLERAMGKLGHGGAPNLEDIPPGLTAQQMQGLIGAVDTMFEAGMGGMYGFDLSNVYNIMQRGNGQLVIVDPFSSFDELDENIVNESTSDEAWELVGSTVPEIKTFIQQMGFKNDSDSVSRITPMIDAAPERQIPAGTIPKLKNLTADHLLPGHDANILQGIKKISGAPNAREQYIKLMQLRDRQETNLPGRQARERGYDIGGLFDAVKSGQYEPPVLLRLPTGVYVIGGRTRLYAALAAGIPVRVKVLDPSSLKQNSKQVTEAREPVMNILRKELPDWPDYVIKDFLYTRIPSAEFLDDKLYQVQQVAKMVQPNSWRLHQKMPLTFNMLNPKTRYFMKTKRQFGDRNPFLVPRDRERLEDAIRLVREKGIENLPPVIMLQRPDGLELLEGWHRTMAAFRQHPEGFLINAWIGQATAVTENFADGKNPGRKGLSRRVGIPKKATLSKLEKIAKSSTGERRRMAQWQLNMRRGKAKKNEGRTDEVKILSKVKGKGSEPGQLPKFGREIQPGQEERYLGQQVGKMGRYQIWRDWLGGQLSYHLFDPQERRVIVTSFGSQYKDNPDSYIIHGLYAAPDNPVRAHEFYHALIQDQGLTLISDRKQSPGGNKVWINLERYPDVEIYGFDTKTGKLLNFGPRDAEMYAIPSASVSDRDSRYVANNLRLVATAR